MGSRPEFRRRERRLRQLAALAVLALAAACPTAAADEAITIWQWTDAGGVTRYTPDFERIPSAARPTAVAMQPGASPPTSPVYFDPNPRESVVSVPDPGGTTSLGSAAATPAAPAEDLESRVRELEAQISADEEALKRMISSPGGEADAAVSAELREIAARLPKLQAQLASLRQRRGGSGGP